MKQIIVIVGPNGIGKSTTAQVFLQKNTQCAYIDSDACRAINPFPFTEATKKTVQDNIYCLFKNYLLCDDIEMIVFPYGFHGERKEIFDDVINRLSADGMKFKLVIVVLKCSLEENLRRATSDGRDRERVERGIKNTFHFYETFDYPSIDSTELSPEEVAEQLRVILNSCS